MDLFERVEKKSKKTERGELLVYFCGKLNKGRAEKKLKPLTIPRVAFMLTRIPTKDLYYIFSCCNSWENDGRPWSALFWKLLDYKKHGTSN